MQIVLDIDENVFTRLFDNGIEDCEIANDDLSAIAKSIRKGTPLPKGHGRLIDADMLDDVIMQMNESGSQITRYEYKVLNNVLFEMPTIIKADKAESEDMD